MTAVHVGFSTQNAVSSSQDAILIKNGLIVNHDEILRADILVEGEKIKQIAPTIIPLKNAKVIDAQGLYIFPGGVDPDSRLLNFSSGIPIVDDFKKGSLASLCGGTTTLINEVPVYPGSSITEAYNQQRASLDAECYCDFNLNLSVPRFTQDIGAEMRSLAEAKKVASFSFLFRSDASRLPVVGLDEDSLAAALKLCSSFGIIPTVLACGDPAILDKISEEVYSLGLVGPESSLLANSERFEAATVSRVAVLAADVGCPVLFTRIHSSAAMEALVEHRTGGGIVLGETSVAAIGSVYAGNTVTHSDWAKAASCVANPPIRPELTVARKLLKHIAAGEIFAVGSAHRAIGTNVRASLGLGDFRKIPIGQSAAGCRLSALWKCGVEKEALLDPCAFVAATSANPARLFNLYPRKGRISEGSDADIVIWNPMSKSDEEKLVSSGVVDPFEGLQYSTCRPEVVILRGQLAIIDGRLVDELESKGKFIQAEAFGNVAFGRIASLNAISKAFFKPVIREAYSGPIADSNPERNQNSPPKESYFYRKEEYDNVPREALPPGQRTIHTSVKTAHPPGGTSNVFWWNN